MKLFPIINDTKHRAFCGPLAIAALTGVPISRIEKMIRRVRGPNARDEMGRKIAVRSTYMGEILTVLERLGCKIEQMRHIESTAGKFFADTAHMQTAILVEVARHVMAVAGGSPANAFDAARAKRRVVRAWKITAPATPRYTIEDALVTKREPKPKKDIKAVRAERLAKQIEQWEAKERRARNALKRLRPKLRRYQKLGLTP